MPLKLTRYSQIDAFIRRAEPFLLANEAEHCLPLGIAATLAQRPNAFSAEPPYLATVDEGRDVVTVALRTPPYNVVLSRVRPGIPVDDVVELLARDLHASNTPLPGVLGPTEVSLAFARCWHHLTGQSYHQEMREGLYQLDVVQPVHGVAGRLRRATEADRALLERWIVAFNLEALGPNEPLEPSRWVEQALTSPMRGLYLWETTEPVAMVGYSGPTAHGVRIGPVYTPPEHRRHGYASAATAAVSQHLLDSGRQFCFLFTDLANPTSNHIYQTIGYHQVGNVAVYRFTGKATDSRTRAAADP